MTSARRRRLVAYDICDPARLRQVAKVCEAHGYRIQLSVFVCDLTPRELFDFKVRLLDHLNQRVDRVAIFDLGPANEPFDQRAEILGTGSWSPPTGSQIL
ncbi:MAG: CRISPR-associated endonuclease Cas2 [Actinobacteria bacterium]|nr:CRISPR-associated endonuclease Cas2 [Actinomycetota bacterium]MCB9389529.1 CRISPR-associated endonuclease Cas2 [Acidimicrobiia bacterium]